MDTIREKIERLKASAGQAQIVLVTKTVSPEKIREALVSGLLDLGENRVQELLEKQAALQAETQIRWHMIGHLQTNKVKQVVGRVALIHSLDRMELAEEIERQAVLKQIKTVPCLIQVNSSGEASKFGLKPEAVEAFVAGLQTKAIQIRGLMTIGPNIFSCHPREGGDPKSLMDSRLRRSDGSAPVDEAADRRSSSRRGNDKIRQAFRETRELRDRLKKKFSNHRWDILSMGMSSDYTIAIEEGATLIRVGTAVFGNRPK